MRIPLICCVLAPAALAQGPDNTMWATNFSGSIRSISKIDIRGEVLTNAVPGALTPFGLAVDPSGNVWCGSNGTAVARIDPTGTTATTFPVGSFPQSVAIDMTGSVWVANRSSNSVTKLDAQGNTLVTVPLPAGTSPIGVVVDVANQTWVAGFHTSTATTNTLTVLDNAGTIVNTFMYTSPGTNFGFSFPAAAPNGNIWVANQALAAVLQVDQLGNVVTTTPIATGLSRGIAVDGLGFAWVANQGTAGNCLKLDPTGAIVATFPRPATSFTTVSIDGNGDPWVFGFSAGKAVKLWQPDATSLVEVLIPSGGSAWGGDSGAFHLARTVFPSSDFDGDGFQNGIETVAGTNPFLAQSTPVRPQPIQSGLALPGTSPNFTFRLRSDANLGYVAAISLGNTPTFLPDGRSIPLSLPIELFSIGVLDGNGDARTSFPIPPNPLFVGITFYMAWASIDPAASLGIRTISNELAVTVR